MNGAVENQLVNKWKASEGRSLLQMATGYKSSKDIPPLTSMSREKVHNALLAAGMTPGLGNVADAADAILYAAEGEFGSAGLSAAAMTPMVGQLVSAKRALKAAKKSGEKMVTVYRGVNKWHKGSMVRKGNFVGGSQSGELYTTTGKKFAEQYEAINPNSILLEFEVPKSYIKGHAKLGKIGQTSKEMADMMIFKDGLPKEFLKKVHK